MGWLFSVFYYYYSNELGASLIYILHLLLFIISILPQKTFGQVEETDPSISINKRIEYYRYWNPYRRVLGTRGEPHSFYGKNYYQVLYNKDDRIKSVTRFGDD